MIIGCSVFLPTTIRTYGMKDKIIAKPIEKPRVKIVVKTKNNIGCVTKTANDFEI